MFTINFLHFCYNNIGLDPDWRIWIRKKAWIHALLAPDSIESVDLDQDSRQAKMIKFCHVLTKKVYY